MESAGSPTNMQGQFQPPPNMPNINFNAPVIRLGVGGQEKQGNAGDRLPAGQGGGRSSNAEPMGNRGRAGLGAGGDSSGGRNIERERAAVRESMMALQPPTREEVARTIFIGGLGEGAPDDSEIESFLRCAGKLRRWTRVRDAEDKPCKFGFAEYEDVESLEAANEIYNDFFVPIMKNGAVVKDEESEAEAGLDSVKKMKLLVVVDQASKEYITEWTAKRNEDENARQFRIDGCREDLRQCLSALVNRGSFAANGMNGDADGDVAMINGNGTDEFAQNAEVVNIPLSLEDELSDIPAEMRTQVAEEIKAFRDRSNRRDMERMKREEELEARERTGNRVNRLASPPPSGAPSGPASAANGAPVGPRDRSGPAGAPAGPRGYRGVQIPSDYANGVAFVGANGVANSAPFTKEEEDSDASDEELERRRQEKKKNEKEKEYQDAERKLKNRERNRAAAQSRKQDREMLEQEAKDRDAEAMRRKISSWDDDEVLARGGPDQYYYDRSTWTRNRTHIREREEQLDDKDRAQENRENADERRRKGEAMSMADDFMDQMSSELEARGTTTADKTPAAANAGPGLKISLGSAAKKSKPAPTAQPPRRAMAEVEGLLEDEEDAAAAGLKRGPLKPLTDLSTAPSDPEERAAARQALASEIPTDMAELFAWPLKKEHLTVQVIEEQIRPFVEKKVVEFLGVQEDMLVEVVVEGLKEGKEAREVVGEVEGALEEEEAENLIRKVWRVAVFVVEERARGLND